MSVTGLAAVPSRDSYPTLGYKRLTVRWMATLFTDTPSSRNRSRFFCKLLQMRIHAVTSQVAETSGPPSLWEATLACTRSVSGSSRRRFLGNQVADSGVHRANGWLS